MPSASSPVHTSGATATEVAAARAEHSTQRTSSGKGPRKNPSHVSRATEVSSRDMVEFDAMSISSQAISEGTSSMTDMETLQTYPHGPPHTNGSSTHAGMSAAAAAAAAAAGPGPRRPPDRHVSMPAITAPSTSRPAGASAPQRTASMNANSPANGAADSASSPANASLYPPGSVSCPVVSPAPSVHSSPTSPKHSHVPGEEGATTTKRAGAKQVPSRLSLMAGPRSGSMDVMRSVGSVGMGAATTRTPADTSGDGRSSVPMGGHGMSSRVLSSSSSLATLQKTVESIMLQDMEMLHKVQASMRGISSLAKETSNLEVGRDATGATCINQYVVVKTLGRGSFGKVKLCLNTLDGSLYAIKMVNRTFIAKQLQKPTKGLRRRVPTRNTSGVTSSASANVVLPSGPSGELQRPFGSITGASPPPALLNSCGGPASPMGMGLAPPTPGSVGNSGSHGPGPAADGMMKRALSGQETNVFSTTGVSSRMSTDDNANPFDSVMREIAVLKKLDHPNVVKLHEVIDPPGASYMMLVMEYMERGPVLETKAQGGFASFPERIARDYFRQTCAGLDYLHYNNVAHGDLKPENLLVTAAGQLKIGDFGSARILSDSTASSKVSCTPAFQPPEAIQSGGAEEPQGADVWALGVCLYCFIFGRLPFTGHNLLDISNAILKDELCYPPEVRISPELHDLFEAILVKDPARRISLQAIMQHPWTTEHGASPLPSLRSLLTPPKMIEVSRNETQAAIDRCNMVNMLRARLKEKTFLPGEMLFREGEEAHCIYMIMSGVVEITSRLAGPGVDAQHLVDELDEQSFSVDLDESFTLDYQQQFTPADAQLDLQDGKLHIDRYKAQALKDRMRGMLMGRQAEYVTEVKGPGQVIGDVGLDKNQVAQHKHSARARDHVTVVKLTEESFLKALQQQQDTSGLRNDDTGDLLTTRNMEDDNSGGGAGPGGSAGLTTILDNDVTDVSSL